MRRKSVARHLTTALTIVAGWALATAVPAGALPTCGSLDQPECVEDPPPGVELRLSAEENPHGLQPLSETPSATKPLWPRVKGHEPFGFNAVSFGRDGTSVEEEAMLHEEVGASMARITADWGTIQHWPNRTQGGPSWTYEQNLDPMYRAYVKRGIRPMFVILRTPRRFTKHADTARNSRIIGCETSDACYTPPDEEHLDELGAFAADLVKRYPLAAGIEVWNEPNISNPFWGGDLPDPEYYTRLLDAVHDAVKAVRPTMPVLGGALAPFVSSYVDPSGYQRMAVRPYLARMLKAGAAPNMDALSYHPYLGAYSQWPTLAEQERAMVRRFIDQDNLIKAGYTDAAQPIEDRVVATEFGASTTEGYTEQQQAYWLHLRYNAWDTDHWLFPLPVDGAFIHKAVEETNPDYGAMQKVGYGLVRVRDAQGRFATKPAFCKFRIEVGGFPDCPSAVALAP